MYQVDQQTGCWNWIKTISDLGYGVFYQKGRRVLAHRQSFQESIGKIPGKLFVCHRCDNRRCINPEHLFLGDHKANMQDMVAKGRHKPRTGCCGGKKHMGLSASLLLEYGERIFGRKWQPELAVALGVDGSTVRRWVSGAIPIPNPAAAAIRCFLSKVEAK